MSEEQTKKVARKVEPKKVEEAKAPKEKKEKTPTFKYTVATLAEELGTDASGVRVKLRKAGVKKEGRSYGWNNQDEFKKVVKQLKETQVKKSKPKDDEGDD
mgnify:CR=1 FL=1